MPFRLVLESVVALRQAARDDGRHPGRPRGQPEHLGDRGLGEAEASAARRPRRAGQHGEQQDVLLGPEALDPRLRRARRHRLRRGPRPRRGSRPGGDRASTRCTAWSATSASSTSAVRATRCSSCSVHPGVTVEDVQDASSFPIHRPDEVPLTREPSPGELMLIRDMLDPKGLRDREVPPVEAPDDLTPRNRSLRSRLRGDPEMIDQLLRTPLTELAGVRHPVVQTGMGWVAGPRLVVGTANAGGLGILASATMTLEELERAILEVKGRTDQPFGVNLRADAGDAPDRVDLLIKHGVKVASFALAPKKELIAQAQGPRRRGDAQRRPGPARREGRVLGRRRGDDPGRRGRRPHRHRAHHPAAADRARRGRHPGGRGGRVLRRPRPGSRPLLRRRGDRHGHPLPAHPGLDGPGRGEAALPRGRPQRHRRHRQGRRHAPPDAAHRPRRGGRGVQRRQAPGTDGATHPGVQADERHVVAAARSSTAARCARSRAGRSPR